MKTNYRCEEITAKKSLKADQTYIANINAISLGETEGKYRYVLDLSIATMDNFAISKPIFVSGQNQVDFQNLISAMITAFNWNEPEKVYQDLDESTHEGIVAWLNEMLIGQKIEIKTKMNAKTPQFLHLNIGKIVPEDNTKQG
jgi:hypothetical protein